MTLTIAGLSISNIRLEIADDVTLFNTVQNRQIELEIVETIDLGSSLCRIGK